MIRQQMQFTESEAITICEMLARFTKEDYSPQICPGIGIDENGHYATYHILVWDTNDTVVAEGEGYMLIDALFDAWQSTPEGKLDAHKM